MLSVSLNVNVWDGELELVLFAGLTRFTVGAVVSIVKFRVELFPTFPAESLHFTIQ